MRVLSLTAQNDLSGARAVLIEMAQNDLRSAAKAKIGVREQALNIVACMVQVRAPLATKDELREVMATFDKATTELRKKSDRRSVRAAARWKKQSEKTK
jgi:hypothetical protein